MMCVIESLKEIEMSLSEIKEFMDKTTPEIMVEVFKEKAAKISEKINNLIRNQKAIEKKISITELANEADFTKIVIKKVDEEYLYLSEPLSDFTNKENAQSITDFYNTCMIELNEKYSIGGMTGKEQLIQGDFNNFKYLFAKTQYTTKLSLFRKEKCKQVIGYHVGNYETLGKTYSKLLNYMDAHQLEIINFGYGECILDAISINDSNKYVTKITIPVHF